MLTDTIAEEEFELKEEEPWYDKQDLEHGTVSWHSLSLKPFRWRNIQMTQIRTFWRWYGHPAHVCFVTFRVTLRTRLSLQVHGRINFPGYVIIYKWLSQSALISVYKLFDGCQICCLAVWGCDIRGSCACVSGPEPFPPWRFMGAGLISALHFPQLIYFPIFASFWQNNSGAVDLWG